MEESSVSLWCSGMTTTVVDGHNDGHPRVVFLIAHLIAHRQIRKSRG